MRVSAMSSALLPFVRYKRDWKAEFLYAISVNHASTRGRQFPESPNDYIPFAQLFHIRTEQEPCANPRRRSDHRHVGYPATTFTAGPSRKWSAAELGSIDG